MACRARRNRLDSSRAAAAKSGNHGEDNVGFDLGQTFIVQPHSAQSVRRQIGNDHIGCRNQFLHNFAPLRFHRVQRQASLVAPELQKHGAIAGFSDRRDEAVFRAVNFFDADDVGTKICQECRAVRARDIAPKV